MYITLKISRKNEKFKIHLFLLLTVPYISKQKASKTTVICYNVYLHNMDMSCQHHEIKTNVINRTSLHRLYTLQI